MIKSFSGRVVFCFATPEPYLLTLAKTDYPSISFFMPPPFVMGGRHIASLLSVRTSRMSCPERTKNGFRAISFEYIGVLDSYFIHRYIIIKYRSSSITDKIHRFYQSYGP